MSGFELVPLDGGDPIHLGPGETVLGRGPLLGVSDKRVSRHHGLLENQDGRLRLKPTHVNPCFVQSSLTSEPRPLQKDVWHLLHHGDLFSLLPGQFVFQVEAVGGGGRAPRNGRMVEGEKDEVPDAGPAVEPDPGLSSPQEEQTPAASSSSCVTDSHEGNSAQTQEVDVGPPVPRKRRLPAWMMLAAGAQKNPSAATKVRSVKRSKTPSTSSKHTEGPRKRRRNMSDEESVKDVPSEEPTARNQSGHSRSEGSGESDDVTVEAEGSATTHMSGISEEAKPEPQTPEPEPAESVGSGRDSASSKPRLRTPCPYGKDCYRKNPIHFQECSHPGNADYEEEDDGAEEADRPECPYGTDCYRKNPLHRKEFSHTRRAARATRTVPKRVVVAPDDEEDEEDYDDSFIDDDSEDVGNDSDYVPPDSDDSSKEDLRRLQSEAEVLMKRP